MNMTIRDVEHCLLGAGRTDPDKDAVVGAVRTDSRAVGSGDVFFCLSGERFDGHEFADQALKNGALAVVSEQLMFDLPEDKVIMVPSSVAALGRLAACAREKAGIPLIAVTGSAGKTTVKELLASALSTGGKVAKNAGNLNNQIGLPMSMLEADGDEDFWVMELGISKPGDMDELGPTARPDIAVINNIGHAHTEGLGSLRGVARAKASLLRHLKSDGKAAVCMDYPELWEEARKIVPDLMSFSTRDMSADCHCEHLGDEPDGRGHHRLTLGNRSIEITLPFSGAYHAENLAAAACGAHLAGLSPDDTAAGYATTCLPAQRFCRRRIGPHLLIDDTYNANPLSMKKAMEAAASLAEDRPLILVLGEMRELGENSAEAHRELGQKAAESGAHAVFFKGESAETVREGLEASGRATVFAHTETPSSFLAEWRELGKGESVVLFKGSRSLRMEDFFQALAGELNT